MVVLTVVFQSLNKWDSALKSSFEGRNSVTGRYAPIMFSSQVFRLTLLAFFHSFSPFLSFDTFPLVLSWDLYVSAGPPVADDRVWSRVR